MTLFFMDNSSSARLRIRQQKSVVKIPIASVRPNPFTGPVPNAQRAPAEIKVVRLASTIVEKALS